MTDRRHLNNRRTFLQGLSGAGALSFLGGTGILSAMGNAPAHAAEVSGYKALVCLFMHGGQDCNDTVLPFDQASYDGYAQLRSGLLANYASNQGGSNRTRERLLALNPANSADFGNRQFALPDDLTPIKTLFDTGNAAILGNVGPLIQPMSRAEYQSGAIPRPKQLYSHNDQQSTWKSNSPEGEIIGWGGKFADTVVASGANQEDMFTAITLDGNTVFLSGDTVQQYALNTNGPQQVNGLKNRGSALLGTGRSSERAKRLLEDHYRNLAQTNTNLFKRDMSAINNRAFTLNETYSTALENAPVLQTQFQNNSISRQLRSVANTINIRSALGVGRQVFFVGMGGFDTHDNQAINLPNLQRIYADAIATFYQASVEMGAENEVTLFTASDFGRALRENGNGTDHGWGGHQFIVGGAVNGNRIYGDIPPYATGHDQDAGNGRWIPQTSVEQYAATLGRWFGLTDGELASALPNLANFTRKDLGFMTGGVV
ncbi:MAG: hypothetical protein COA91_12720 [Robiginitomaculum sp.]|nr:MAG: hypothetical protein COA91_12720 [Robiginitomaculum sp.]